ncbi:unnamed protein product [Rhizophagus irregularis]|nr:unnamed protein product [Rhizophagus irregularis]
MKTLGENFTQWNILWPIRYLLAIAFKIIERSRSFKQCEELAIEYTEFVNSLNLTDNVKQKIINDFRNNWICDEWILDQLKQTIVKFYGLKLNRENITEFSDETSFEAGLSTFFNAQSIEQEDQLERISSDKLRRLNLGRLHFLMGYIKAMNNNITFY